MLKKNKDKHRLQNKFNRWPITYCVEYRALRNKINSMIRSAKAAHYKYKLNDPSYGRETW